MRSSPPALVLLLTLLLGPGLGQGATSPGPGPAAKSDARPTGHLPSLLPTTAPSAGGRGRSPAIYPPRRVLLRFSHRRHLRRKTGCLTCHPMALRSRTPRARILPDGRTCQRCHETRAAQHGSKLAAVGTTRPARKGVQPGGRNRCSFCHSTNPRKSAGRVLAVPAANLRFSHVRHIKKAVRRLSTPGSAGRSGPAGSALGGPAAVRGGRSNVDSACLSCHAGVRRRDLATAASLPTMARCIACHSRSPKARRLKRCSACHLSKPDGVLITTLGRFKLVPGRSSLGEDHSSPFWRRRHRGAGSQSRSYCASCHRSGWCLRCHNGAAKGLRLHPPGWSGTHGPAARRGTPRCSSCHRHQTSCLRCHVRLKIGTTTTGRPLPSSSKRPAHPTKRWNNRRHSLHHGARARVELQRCASCHRGGWCTRCHSAARGRKANPHPVGFTGRRLSGKARRVCLKCHLPTDRRIR